jgi:6-pyruvoyltetrahydropterin/6-carboxytetrahydropterin synthase
MVYRIDKTFTFSAAHFLHGLPPDHPCSRMHGHNYIVKLILEADVLNEVGFVRDYRELDKFKGWLDTNFDHQLINDLEQHMGGQPTAEIMAQSIFEVAANLYPEVVAVGVSETEKTWAWYMPHDIPARDRVINTLEDLSEEPPSSADALRVGAAVGNLLERAFGDTNRGNGA